MFSRRRGAARDMGNNASGTGTSTTTTRASTTSTSSAPSQPPVSAAQSQSQSQSQSHRGHSHSHSPQPTATVQDGIQLLNTAMSLESSGDLAGADNCYVAALDILLTNMKNEHNEQKKQVLREMLTQYMARAESVKHRLRGSPNSSLPTSSPATSVSRSTSSTSASSSPSSTSSTQAKVQSILKSLKEEKTTQGQPSQTSNISSESRALIEAEMVAPSSAISFNDIIGMDVAKQALREMVIFPALRPDLFTGIRRPPRGILLYGPPGNGKTLIARAIAAEARCNFFPISAASLMSKHLGEGEKQVKALFAVAQEKAPSIIFIDEIDSILSRRSAEEHEASRRLKTEFFIQFDSIASPTCDKHVVLIAATNIPEGLDEALLRRLTRHIYLDIPSRTDRASIITFLLSRKDANGHQLVHRLSQNDINTILDATDGYSNADLTAVISDASMGPIRDLLSDGTSMSQLLSIQPQQLSPILLRHVMTSVAKHPKTVSAERLIEYKKFSDRQNNER